MRLFTLFWVILLISLFVLSTFQRDLNCQQNNTLVTLSQTDIFPEDRSALKVPEELWDYILSNIGHGDKELGYTFEEMDFFDFYGNEFRLKIVWDLFRDVSKLVDYSGIVGDFFLENFQSPSAIASYCYDMIEMEDETSPKETTRFKNFNRSVSDEDFSFDTPLDKDNWDVLPKQIQDFITGIIESSVNSTVILDTAYNKSFIAQNLGIEESELDNINRFQLYEFISQPWRSAQPSAESFNSMYEVDFDALSSGTSLFLSGVEEKINELKDWLEENVIEETNFEKIRFNSPGGRVCILGTGKQEISEEFSFIIDLGGNDSYSGSNAVPRSFSHPVGAIIDLSGNDIYDAGIPIAGFCTGLFGIGSIFDLSGNDEYLCGESGIASAWHGTGILVDYDGDDKYKSTSSWSQGAAHAGVGLLMDLSGDDIYLGIQQSQGFGSSLGIGAILDVKGNDRYNAEGAWSEPFHNNTALSMGAGFGRRADYGDGRSLAGGVGILVEGEGDDSYWGPVYILGCGYWWAVGIFEDRGGNDKYRCLQYSIGSAPHMAIGCAVDLTGDDRYNVDEGYTVAQFQGAARDGCLGVFIDGYGNDLYFFRKRSGGAGDLNSIGFFWDRFGDDVYDSLSVSNTFGASSTYEPHENMRDEIMTVGIFLDSDGHDLYNIDPNADEENEPECADNKEWYHNTGPVFWGYGLDTDWFSSR